jgi:hypothetical protein
LNYSHPLLLHGLESERLQFKKLSEEDLSACLSFFEHPLSNRYWKTTTTDPRLLCQEWFDKQMWRYKNKKGGTNLLISKASGEIVGWCGLLI